MRTSILIILLTILFVQITCAQSQLLIKKRGRIIASYQEGDHLKYKLQDEDHDYNQLILGFDGDNIRFRFYDIHISEIEVIKAYPRKKNFPAVVSSATATAAVFFLAIDLFNQGIVNGNGFEPSEQTLMIAGSLAATSLIAKLLAGNKVKIDARKFTLEMM